MVSTLIISEVENLQEGIINAVKKRVNTLGIYLSLNKTQDSTEKMLKKSGIDTKKIFFIDGVTSERKSKDALHVPPIKLENINYAISLFIKELQGKKYILIDALSTLLIYNNEDKVAKFIKEITDYASGEEIEVIAFSPKTKGEELLKKIFNFFDYVKGR